MSIISIQGPFTRQRLPNTREAWLLQRKQGFGGSDAGAIMGASKYGSSLTVYGDKLDLNIEQKEETAAMRRGRVMEPVVLREFRKDFAEKDGRAFRATRYPWFLRSTTPGQEFMTANLDGVIEIEGMDGPGILEIKTADPRGKVAEAWRNDEIYDAHYWQMQAYLAVTGLKWAVYVLWMDGHLEWKIVPRNDERIAELVAAMSALWQMIQDKTPPAPSGLDAEDAIIRALHGEVQDDQVQLPEEAGDFILQLAELQQQKDELERQVKELRQRLRVSVGSHAKGVYGEHFVRVSVVSSNRFDSRRFKTEQPDLFGQYVKKSQYERLTIK